MGDELTLNREEALTFGAYAACIMYIADNGVDGHEPMVLLSYDLALKLVEAGKFDSPEAVSKFSAESAHIITDWCKQFISDGPLDDTDNLPPMNLPQSLLDKLEGLK